MTRILTKLALILLIVPVSAQAQAALEGRWANPKHSVIVNVARCGNALCGTVSWASPRNKEKGVTPGTRVLSDLRPLSDGLYRGRALEPKRNISGSATVRQDGPNVMVVKGCAVLGLVCREQRWTRVS
ncbi:MAG TPA: DUF2147 domain-containing protein [Sphingomicrobium sp.]